MLLGILVPLIEHVEFLGCGFGKILDSTHDFDDTGAARAIEAASLHFDASLLARLEQEFARLDFRRRVRWQHCDFWHTRSTLRERSIAFEMAEVNGRTDAGRDARGVSS